MGVAAEHRYQKVNRRQIDGRKPSPMMALEQEVVNLTDDVAELKSKLAAALFELDTVKRQAAADVEAACKDATEQRKIAQSKHERMMEYFRMFRECERGHKKASAVLMCLKPDVLADARIDAKIYYPQLWPDESK